MKLLEIEDEGPVSREEAAARLRELADQLARHNELSFTREGTRYSVKVPNEIVLEVELELEVDGESSLEIELSW
ncbi:MAG TPA: amphi-Trp domain-containing protein [Acidimicrobiales bacterium]|nr:amphi-Trp domain-containing protein [Acidimicrobiales bacterium]